MTGFLLANHAALSHGLRTLVFFVFLVGALSIRWTRTPEQRRRRVSMFLGFTLCASYLAGLAQKDYWPFSAYQLMQGIWSEHFTYHRVLIVGVDEAGREFQAPPESWAPLSPFAIQEWMRETYPSLSPAQKSESLRFLLERAERARASQASASGSRWWTHAVAAPNWWLSAPSKTLPLEPFVGLRLYDDEWIPGVKWSTGRETKRTLLDAWPR